MNRLVDVVRNGRLEEARALLAAGADPDQRSESGDTALHEAVRGGHCELAARLLANGADPQRTNASGVAALSVELAGLPTLHRIRQEYQRLPASPYAVEPRADDVRAVLDRLRRDGIVRVSNLLEPGELRQLQREFRACVWRLRLGRALPRGTYRHYDQAEYWYPARRTYVTNDAFRHSPTFLRIACGTRVVELARLYLQKPFHLKRAQGMRYLPAAPMDAEQFHWHHDMEDRQLKAMVLLTDVGETDQYMTYVRGSHQAFHPYQRFLRNRLDFDYCRTYLDDIEIFKATGRAGDVFFFDSNGMHSGNRASGAATRDALFLEFTADRNWTSIWGTALRRSEIPEALKVPGGPLSRFLEVAPKWTRKEQKRTRPTWAVSLEDPRTWV